MLPMKRSENRRARYRSSCAPANATSHLVLEHLEDRVLLTGTAAGLPGLETLALDRGAYALSRVLVRVPAGAACTDTQLGSSQAILPGLCQVALAPGVAVDQALAA